MKNYIIKLSCSIFFVALFLFEFTALKGVSFVSIVKTACAANWGGSSVCGASSYGAGYEICPHSGVAPNYCVTSADFIVTVNGTLIPPQQKFEVTIEPADGSGNACYTAPNSDVSCLDRTLIKSQLPEAWTGQQTQPVTFDRIGCSLGNVTGCTNSYRVKVRFLNETSIDPNITCAPPADQIFTIQNGVPKHADFFITCSAIATPTPSPTPPGCPVPVAPVPVVTCNECTN